MKVLKDTFPEKIVQNSRPWKSLFHDKVKLQDRVFYRNGNWDQQQDYPSWPYHLRSFCLHRPVAYCRPMFRNCLPGWQLTGQGLEYLARGRTFVLSINLIKDNRTKVDLVNRLGKFPFNREMHCKFSITTNQEYSSGNVPKNPLDYSTPSFQ